MTQEDKELLLKDLCARLPYGVIVNVKGFDYDYNDKLTQIYKGVGCSIQVTTNMPYDIEQVKPYLFPLSSITIEQEKELSKLGVSYCEYALHDDIRGLGIYVDEAYIFFEFCYKHHIDFLGLIERGLALNATGLNVY